MTSEELLKLGIETNEMDFAIASKFITFDNIIDILKICRKRHGQNYCMSCPLNKEKDCIEIMANGALDFINYLKEKNERLQKSLDNMTDALIKTDEACRKSEAKKITRCKDCYNVEDLDGTLYCWYFNKNVYADDFCSNGG